MAKFLSRAPRWLFAAIPLGFVALVALMIAMGQRTGGPTHSPYESGDILQSSDSPEPDPAEETERVLTPSGPEYDDNEVIIE